MKNTNQVVYENRLSYVFKHVGHLSEVIEALTSFSDPRGIVEIDGRIVQTLSGKLGLKKEDIDCMIKLGELYGFLKRDRCSSKVLIVARRGRCRI